MSLCTLHGGHLVHNTDISVGVLAQAVVDVMCDHVAAAHHRKQQQREGVGTS
jgi:hypothetical protein